MRLINIHIITLIIIMTTHGTKTYTWILSSSMDSRYVAGLETFQTGGLSRDYMEESMSSRKSKKLFSKHVAYDVTTPTR